MKLNQQVISLELSKKLKALGVRQESAEYWYYLEAVGTGKIIHSTPKLVDKQYRDKAVREKYEWDYAFISAFTVAELGELLPEQVEVNNSLWTLKMEKDTTWRIHYVGEVEVNAATEADARALMLIYLLEHNLISL